MPRAALRPAAQNDGVAVLTGQSGISGRCEVAYSTRTGALLRVDGVASGAFDREHGALTCDLPAAAKLALEVELRALPANGLPAGPGLRWWLMNLLASQRPRGFVEVMPVTDGGVPPCGEDAWPLIGHSHLDVAWLWTYEETQRKAMRTFAIAANLLERHSDFIFSQGQPQLYEFVKTADPVFFERIRGLVRAERFDASIAALWVESDCNLPSGESLLRQMLLAHRFCVEHFHQTPAVAWLPDSFGFANTLPTLLVHAGIRYFATTKLQWNDTTRFPYAQFRWRGPDGSEVVAAMLDSYDGALGAYRVARSRARKEPVIAGYGDGGGGVTEAMIAQARRIGKWTRPLDWLRGLRTDALPIHQDELYLEYHRGVFTSHHDVKRRNAALERELEKVENAVSRCIAMGSEPGMILRWRDRLDEAWELVLRNQFHDVLPGTSIGAVYADANAEYDAAEQLLTQILAEARSVLPQAAEKPRPVPCEPRREDGVFAFRNGLIEALVRSDGSIEELKTARGRNTLLLANVLTLYRDRPAKWDAWNIDAGYARCARRPAFDAPRVEDCTLIVPVRTGRSHFEMCVALFEGEPFLRVELRGDWRERHTLLRCESRLAIESDRVVYGTPHGTIERSARAQTPAERAKFEVPGQRFALARSPGASAAIFALDTYGWNAAASVDSLRVGHSLLRAPMWPHPDADAGAQRIVYGFAPLDDPAIGGVERLWRRFARQLEPQLFRCDDSALAIVACKPAQDADGVILRLRECDGLARSARIHCSVPPRTVEAVDGLERRIGGDMGVPEDAFTATLGSYGLQSFRVRF